MRIQEKIHLNKYGSYYKYLIKLLQFLKENKAFIGTLCTIPFIIRYSNSIYFNRQDSLKSIAFDIDNFIEGHDQSTLTFVNKAGMNLLH